LHLLEKNGPLAKSRMAKSLGVTKPAAMDHVRRLSECGLVVPVESEKVTPGRGRPLELWDVDRAGNYTIGVCFEPPVLVLGLADFSDHVIFQQEYDLSGVTSNEQLMTFIDTFTIEAQNRVSARKGTLRASCVCVPGWASMPMPRVNFISHFREHYGLECFASGLYTANSFGEAMRFDRHTVVGVLNWDLGFAFVPCYNNQILFFGQLAADGKELGLHDYGHVRIVRDGRPCKCGQKGCLEAYTGGWSIIRELNRPDIQRLADIVTLAQGGDEQVLSELNKAAEILGDFLSSICQLVGVEKLAVTGPLSQVFPLVRAAFANGLSKRLSEQEIAALMPTDNEDYRQAMLLGSCRAAREMFYQSCGEENGQVHSWAGAVEKMLFIK